MNEHFVTKSNLENHFEEKEEDGTDRFYTISENREFQSDQLQRRKTITATIFD